MLRDESETSVRKSEPWKPTQHLPIRGTFDYEVPALEILPRTRNDLRFGFCLNGVERSTRLQEIVNWDLLCKSRKSANQAFTTNGCRKHSQKDIIEFIGAICFC